MIAVSNIELYFSGRVIFDKISFLIQENDKIGLTGRNGAGKSTLLKVLKGMQPVDGGEIMYPRGTIIGYLPQELQTQSPLTVIEEARSAFSYALSLLNEKERILHKMETRTDYESEHYMQLVERLGEVEHEIELHDGYAIDEQTERVLKGLGFEADDFHRPIHTLSGGWQMRVELAKILLQKPHLILLDEPTNHLDMDSVLWLEKFLKDYPGAIMMVSHDRTFLDNITNRTLEITQGNIEDYPVPYTRYTELRRERREQLLNAQKNQQREIARMERNIERFRAKASKASFAQSLIKKLDKIELIEVEEEDVSAMQLRFPPAPASGKVVLTARNLTKRYGDNTVINRQSVQIDRGDKIAFVGKNGMGKTTFSRMLVGDLAYDEGEITYGHNVSIGYYAQHAADSMDGNDTVLDVVDRVATGEIRTRLRDLLGCFLFRGDDVFKKVKVLSGGEKGRLALCKLILEPHNFLVLDEPTNHLDMVSKEILKNALNAFEGTLIVVSHDRDFLQGLTNKTYEFTREGIKEHLGSIQDFLYRKAVDDMRSLEMKHDDEPPVSKTPKPVSTPARNHTPTEKNIRKIKAEIQKCEQAIEELEASLHKLENDLANPDTYQELSKQPDVFERYNSMKQQLENYLQRWEELNNQIN
ncbi:MAG: ABC-F family ATP-binding cassette domain-containing protein [Chitinophagales bacterium]|nr:ABC-F family ATP-binding cassette domain-containing protein [Chitinophagales bacterium]MDW8418070.1 ABC-F family ATP-binding cassette domain-containing protein [Chitinophagales bacterium]